MEKKMKKKTEKESVKERYYFSVLYTNFPVVPQLVVQARPKW